MSRTPLILGALGAALLLPALAQADDATVQQALRDNHSASLQVIAPLRGRLLECGNRRPCVRSQARLLDVRAERMLNRLTQATGQEAVADGGLRTAASVQSRALLLLDGAARTMQRSGRVTASTRRILNVSVRDIARAGRQASFWQVPVVTKEPAVPPAPVTEFSLAFDRMSPVWSASVQYYGVRCPGRVSELVVAAPEGYAVRLADGQRVGTGRTTVRVPLRVGQQTTFTVTTPQGTSEHVARCLPEDFPTYTATRTGTTQAQWYLVTPNLGTGRTPYLAIFDHDGAPAWWMKTPALSMDAKLLADGTLAYWVAASDGQEARYEVRTLDGTLVRTLQAVGTSTDNHDLQLLDNGNYLIMSYKPRAHQDLTAVGGAADATVLDAEIQEITPANALVWSWNSHDHIAPEETDVWLPLTVGNTGGVDLVHINSVEDDGDGLIFSARHLNAVYRIRKADGSIDWKLGGTTTPESLTIVNDDALGAVTFGGQHDARRLADGTVSVSDNGTNRPMANGVDRAPRATRYVIDDVADTATLVEEVRDSGITTSGCCGSARRLSNGNWVMGWGLNWTVTENAPDGTRLFGLSWPAGTFTYRAEGIEPGVLSRADLDAAMSALPAALLPAD